MVYLPLCTFTFTHVLWIGVAVVVGVCQGRKNLPCNSTIHKISYNIVYFVYRPFEYVFILKIGFPEESVTFHIFPSVTDGALRCSYLGVW